LTQIAPSPGGPHGSLSARATHPEALHSSAPSFSSGLNRLDAVNRPVGLEKRVGPGTAVTSSSKQGTPAGMGPARDGRASTSSQLSSSSVGDGQSPQSGGTVSRGNSDGQNDWDKEKVAKMLNELYLQLHPDQLKQQQQQQHEQAEQSPSALGLPLTEQTPRLRPSPSESPRSEPIMSGNAEESSSSHLQTYLNERINLDETNAILNQYPRNMLDRPTVYSIFPTFSQQPGATPRRPPGQGSPKTWARSSTGLHGVPAGLKDFALCPSTAKLLEEVVPGASVSQDHLVLTERTPAPPSHHRSPLKPSSHTSSRDQHAPASSTEMSTSIIRLLPPPDKIADPTIRELVEALAQERKRNDQMAFELSVLVKASMAGGGLGDKTSAFGQGGRSFGDPSETLGNMPDSAMMEALQRALARVAKLQEINEDQKERILSGNFARHELEAKRAQLEEICKSLEDARTKWLLEKEDFLEKTQQLTAQLAETNRQLKAAEAECQRLRTEAELERERQEATAQMLRAEVEALDAKRVALIAQTETLLAEGRAARKAQAEAQNRATQLQAELNQLRNELADVTAARAALVVEVGVLKERLEACEKHIRNSEAELASRAQEITSLRQENVQIRREAKQKEEDLNSRLSALSRELGHVEREKERIQCDLDVAREETAAAQIRCETLEEQINAGEAREAQLKSVISDKDAALVRAQEDIQTRDSRIETLLAEIATLTAREQSQNDLIQSLQETIHTKYEPLVVAHSELQDKHNSLENKHNALVRTVAVLNKGLNDTKAQNEGLIAKLENAERAANALSASKNMLQTQVAQLKGVKRLA